MCSAIQIWNAWEVERLVNRVHSELESRQHGKERKERSSSGSNSEKWGYKSLILAQKEELEEMLNLHWSNKERGQAKSQLL